MRLRFWKRKQKESFNKELIPLPVKYPRPVKSYLTIIEPGIGSRIVHVKEISAEEIELPDKSTLFTGVPPDISHHNLAGRKFLPGKKWATVRMHYNLFGMPFTFEPRKWRIFSEEKKRTKLRDWGHKYLEIGTRRIVLILNPERTHAIEKDSRNLVELSEVETYVKDNLSELEKLDHIELPYVTEYDVTEIEMMRTESFQIHDSKAFEKCIKSMENLGEEKSLLWIVISAFVTVSFIVLIFLYFANEGVFAA